MITTSLHLLLADDDIDDCFLFQEALSEIALSVKLFTVSGGIQLMQLFADPNALLPDALFLDLNMPRKGGIECLSEIRSKDNLVDLPVFIYSTSLNMEVVELLYEKGAHYYICKPGDYDNLKKVLSKALTLITQNNLTQAPRNEFILQA